MYEIVKCSCEFFATCKKLFSFFAHVIGHVFHCYYILLLLLLFVDVYSKLIN